MCVSLNVKLYMIYTSRAGALKGPDRNNMLRSGWLVLESLIPVLIMPAGLLRDSCDCPCYSPSPWTESRGLPLSGVLAGSCSNYL